jgi:hypothetical protein
MVTTTRSKITAPFNTPPRVSNSNRVPGSAQSILSNTSDTSTQSRANSLPNHLLSFLAEDIEAYGGIALHCGKQHSVSKLLNYRVKQDPVAKSYYREKTDKDHRRRIQTQVYRWTKKYNNGSYKESVLDKFDPPVTQSSERQTILQIQELPTSPEPAFISSSDQQDLEIQELTSVGIPATITFQEEEVLEEEIIQEDVSIKTMTSVLNTTYTLNIREPWKNPEHILVLLGERSKKNDKELISRLNIYVPVLDIRDYNEGLYSASISADGSCINISKPALAMYQRKKASTIYNTHAGDDKEDKIFEQHEVVCATLAANKNHNSRHIVFQLPSNTKVTNECFNGTSNSLDLSQNIFTVKVKCTFKGTEVVQQFFFLRYSMGLRGTTEAKNISTDSTEEEELAKLLGGMVVEEDDTN